ncbi:MAG: CARDB domain-containing protein [Chloroflexota bacterium]
MGNVAITETVAAGFIVQPGSITPPASLINSLPNGETELVWYFSSVEPGEVPLSFMVETGTETLASGNITVVTGEATFSFGECPGGGTGCLPQSGDGSPPTGSVQLPNGFRDETISHNPFRVQSRLAARLQVDRDVEPDVQFYLPPEGVLVDIGIPIENKEDTLALNTTYTDVVPLIAPIVNIDNQSLLVSDNNGETIWVRNEPFFYNETGGGYLPADGYNPGDTVTLADWDGEYALFDIPGGVVTGTVHFPGSVGLTTTVTIPPEYASFITIIDDNKLRLPVKVLTWDIGDWPGYHYEAPAVRYGILSQELLSRTVLLAGDPNLAPDEIVINGDGGSVYTNLGSDPIFYNQHVTSGAVYVPETAVTPMVSYQDIWTRTHTETLRAAFYDLIGLQACHCGDGSGGSALLEERHAAINVTYGLKADLDNDSQRDELSLVYPSRADQVDLDIIIKTRNLGTSIDASQMVIDTGIFKGLGVQIGPRNGDWDSSWVSNSGSTQLISVENTSAYNHLLFQEHVPADGSSTILLESSIHRFANQTTEGMIKLHDGARFTYRQQAAGPSRYEVFDTQVQGVIGQAPDLHIQKQGTPVLISTYGDTLYYVMTLDDITDPRQLYRNGRGDPFLQSYGFIDAAATTYIGGREDREVLHSIVQPGEMTRIRVEVNNNTGIAFNNVVVAPQPPAGVTVVQSYNGAVPPALYPELPFLYLTTIPDAARGVYFFDVTVDPAYSGPRGQLVEIPINFSADGAPDDFEIPAAQLGIQNESGQVFHTYGPAQSLSLSDHFPDFVNVTGAALVNATDVDALSGAIDRDGRETVFNGFSQMISYTTSISDGQTTFDLPTDIVNRLYDFTTDGHIYVVVQADMLPPAPGPNVANTGAQITYDDELGLNWQETSNDLLVEVHGALILTDYVCEMDEPEVEDQGRSQQRNDGSDDPSTCLLELYEENEVTITGNIYNAGDYVAQGLTATVTLPEGITVLETDPESAVVDGNIITWFVGDVAPGAFIPIEFVALITPDNDDISTDDGSSGGGVPPTFPRSNNTRYVMQAVSRSDGQFVDAFTQQEINATLSGAFNIPVRQDTIQSFIYLPAIFHNFGTQADLQVTNFAITPADLIAGQPAQVVVEVTNNGTASAGEFWVDFYISPTTIPTTAGIRWDTTCSVSPCDGLAWGVESLGVGESIVLTSDAGFSELYSSWTGAFRVTGAHNFYVYVDSWNGEGVVTGAITESDESNNQAMISNRVIGGEAVINATATRPSQRPLSIQ